MSVNWGALGSAALAFVLAVLMLAWAGVAVLVLGAAQGLSRVAAALTRR